MEDSLARSVGTLAAALVYLAPAAAQPQFEPRMKRHLPWDVAMTHAVALGDVDGDGDLDRVTTSFFDTYGPSDGWITLALNDGNGVFRDVTTARMPTFDMSARAVALADVDGDGDLDIIAPGGGDGWHTNATDHLLLNDGGGTFRVAASGRLPPSYAATTSLAVGDVDADGDVDLVLGNPGRQNRLYLNDGAGTFHDATAGRIPLAEDSTGATLLADVDGDRDLDLVFGNVRARDRLLRNDGSGRFTDVTAARLPDDAADTLALAAGDVDGDGDPDLVLGNQDPSAGQGAQDRLYRNDGSGRFVDVTGARMPVDAERTSAVVMTDVDGDRDLDLVFTSDAFDQPRTRLYTNDGTGVFTAATPGRIPPEHDRAHAVAHGDVDGDGDPDLVLANELQDHLYVNDGAGSFTDAVEAGLTAPARQAATRSVALGDVDRDGDTDLVFGAAPASLLLVNDGTARFALAAGRLPAIRATVSAVRLVDVDRDGDLDLVAATRGAQNLLFLNDGTGRFSDVTATHVPVDQDMTSAIAAGDFDRDGDVDLVFGNVAGTASSAQNRMYANDGSGRFRDVTATRLPAIAERTAALEVGDFDGDGDLDLLVGNHGQSRLLRNDGTGSFVDATATALPRADLATAAVAAGDVDGDGDLDVVLGAGSSRLYLNDGTGRFQDATAGRLDGRSALSTDLVLEDLDGDGDVDLLIADPFENRLHWNDGSGTFDAAPASLPLSAAHAVGAGDLDGDGDTDLVFGSAGYTGHGPAFPTELYVNFQGQLEVPHLVVAGGTYRLDVHARGGPPRAVDVALPFVAASTVRRHVPGLGLLRLDPSSIVTLPPFLVPQPDGIGSLRVPVPNDPNLHGVALHAQALLVQWPVSARLLNLTSDRIRP